MQFNIGDKVIFIENAHEYKEWYKKIGCVIDLQYMNMGTKQFVRVSFDEEGKGCFGEYVDVGSWRLQRVIF